MQEVMKKVNELIGTLELRIRKYEASRVKADQEKVKASKYFAETEARVKYIEERDQAISDREKKADLRESLKVMEQRVKGDRDALSNEKARFEKDCDAIKKTITDETDTLVMRKEKLGKAELKLDADRRAYREQVRAEFIKAGWHSPEGKAS